jgi:hypothetical protein
MCHSMLWASTTLCNSRALRAYANKHSYSNSMVRRTANNISTFSRSTATTLSRSPLSTDSSSFFLTLVHSPRTLLKLACNSSFATAIILPRQAILKQGVNKKQKQHSPIFLTRLQVRKVTCPPCPKNTSSKSSNFEHTIPWKLRKRPPLRTSQRPALKL